MAYEYEGDIKSLIIDNPADIDGYYAYDELEEVYRKAKAFDRIVEVFSDNDLYSDEYVMETIEEQIDLMESADDER